MNAAIALSFSGWLAAVALAAADPAPSLVLENPAVRVEVERSPAPHVARLVHKSSGQAVIAAPGLKSLFSIVLAKQGGGQETVEAIGAGQSNAAVVETAAGKRLEARYGRFPGLDLTVQVTAECDARSPLVLWSIRIENNTGLGLAAVRFPQVLAVPAIGQPEDDFLVLPALPGTLIENPATNWRNGQNIRLSYPGNLSAQFMAYQDRTAGLYLASMDPTGHPMTLAVTKQADGLRLVHEFTVVTDEPGGAAGVAKHWQSPYPVALGVTQGTWCDSADLYKKWAEHQPWCARKLADRDDVPEWWKAGPAVHVCEVRKYDSQRTCNGSYYPNLLDHCRDLRDKIDGPVVAMLAGWENHRRWTAGDYFPLFDADQARRTIAQLRADGFRPFFYLSGLFYTYRNEGRDGGDIAGADAQRAAYVVDQKTGKPREFVLNESNAAGGWKRHSYEFCVGEPQTKEFFCRVVDAAQELGVDVLQMDQTVSGAGHECYSSEHGHAPGPGLYQTRGFWDLLDALRRRGKQRSAGFVFLHEEAHEQLIPHLDGFHVREYKERFWYRALPGAVGIPLFSYLYHEYAIGYGGDSAGVSKDNNRWNVRSHAVNLVTGRTPGCAIWSSHAAVHDAHPDQITMLRNHSRLLKTGAQRFLMLGRMLHPYDLAVPRVAIPVAAKKGDKWEKQDFPTPALLTSSWQSPEGDVGHLFVNVAETAQPLRVALDARNLVAAGPYDAEVYRSAQGESFKPLWQRRQLPQEFAAELAPLEVVFVQIRRGGSH